MYSIVSKLSLEISHAVLRWKSETPGNLNSFHGSHNCSQIGLSENFNGNQVKKTSTEDALIFWAWQQTSLGDPTESQS